MAQSRLSRHKRTSQRLPHNLPLYCWSCENHRFSGNRECSLGLATPADSICRRQNILRPGFPLPVVKGACCYRVVLFVAWVVSLGGDFRAVILPTAFSSVYLNCPSRFFLKGGSRGQGTPEPRRWLRLCLGPSLAREVTIPFFKSLTKPPSLPAQLWERR